MGAFSPEGRLFTTYPRSNQISSRIRHRSYQSENPDLSHPDPALTHPTSSARPPLASALAKASSSPSRNTSNPSSSNQAPSKRSWKSTVTSDAPCPASSPTHASLHRTTLSPTKPPPTYDEQIKVESATQVVCDLSLRFGESVHDEEAMMNRPFGVALLIAGIDEAGPQL